MTFFIGVCIINEKIVKKFIFINCIFLRYNNKSFKNLTQFSQTIHDFKLWMQYLCKERTKLHVEKYNRGDVFNQKL